MRTHPTLDPRGGLRRHDDADARHRRGEHGPLAHRRGPGHGPERPAVGRRRLHARAGERRADRRLARRPPRPPPPLHDRPLALHRRLGCLRPRARTSSSSTPPAPSRASAPRSCSRSRSRCSRRRSRARRSAPARSPPTAPRSAPRSPIGPLVGGLLTSGLDWQWIFLINIPIGIACIAITRLYVQESRDPSAHGIDWAGQITLTAGLGLLVLALLRGNERRLDEHADRRRADRRRRRARRVRAGRAARAPADAAAAPVPRRLVHRRPDHRVRDLRVVLRDLPLRHPLPAADRRPVGDRGRPGLPPGHADHARRLGHDRAARPEDPGPHDDRRRPRARRGRHGPVHARRRRVLVADHDAGLHRRLDRHRASSTPR